MDFIAILRAVLLFGCVIISKSKIKSYQNIKSSESYDRNFVFNAKRPYISIGEDNKFGRGYSGSLLVEAIR